MLIMPEGIKKIKNRDNNDYHYTFNGDTFYTFAQAADAKYKDLRINAKVNETWVSKPQSKKSNKTKIIAGVAAIGIGYYFYSK